MFQNKKDVIRKAEARYRAGLEANARANWGFAEEEFHKSLYLWQSIESWDQVACCYCSLGNVTYNKGIIKDSLKHFTAALDIYSEKLQNWNEGGNIAIEIGDIFYEENKIYGAGHYYEMALEFFEKNAAENTPRIAVTNHKLGNVCFFQERFKQAESHYLTALSQYETVGNNSGVASIYKSMGLKYLTEKNYPTASSLLKKAFDIFSQLNQSTEKEELGQKLLQIEQIQQSRQMEKTLKQLDSPQLANLFNLDDDEENHSPEFFNMPTPSAPTSSLTSSPCGKKLQVNNGKKAMPKVLPNEKIGNMERNEHQLKAKQELKTHFAKNSDPRVLHSNTRAPVKKNNHL